VCLKLFEYVDCEFPGRIPSSFLQVSPPTMVGVSSDDEVDDTEHNALLDLDDGGAYNHWEIFSPFLAMGFSIPETYFATELGVVEVGSSFSLFELKEFLYRTIPLLAAARSPYQIRIWNSLGILKGHGTGITQGVFTSQASVVGASENLVVQVISNAEDLPATVLCLYVFRRDSEHRRFCRPVEYLFDQSVSEDDSRKLSHRLFDCISKDFAIPPDQLRVAKYSIAQQSWMSFSGAQELPGESPEDSHEGTRESSARPLSNVGDIMISSANVDQLREKNSNPINADPLTLRKKSIFKDGGMI
jgi:hypothetical protein